MMKSAVSRLMRIDWSSPKARSFDFILAMVGLLAGIMMQDGLMIGLGMAAFLVAVLNPMGRLQRVLRRFVQPARERGGHP